MAIPVARRLSSLDPKDQAANMVLLANAVHDAAFDRAAEVLANGQTAGPLIDELVGAWIKVGQGDMTGALADFDAVAAQKGLQSFGLYHKALAMALAGDLEGADAILSGKSGAITATRRGVIAHAEVLSQLERGADAAAAIDGAFGTDLDPSLTSLRADLTAGKLVPLSIARDAKEGVAEVFYSVATALQSDANEGYTLLYTRITEYLRPDHTDSILLTASLLDKLGQHNLAMQAWQQVPADDPEWMAAETGRIQSLRGSGDLEGAIAAMQALTEKYSDQPGLFVTLGDMLRANDRYADAVAAYDSAVALYGAPQPAQWVVYFARGIANERAKDWPRAEADFRLALELAPGQPQVLNYLGYSYLEMNTNLDEALSMIEEAVKGQPDSGYITDSLGWALYRLGRYPEAVAPMERATELMPVDPIINDHMGDVYWAVGRYREAEFQWHRALSFDPEEADAARIRRKLEVGLDVVLQDEGGDPIKASNDG
jgi:Flp pilus assembly protein TadD